MPGPVAELGPLHRVDGSAAYSHAGYNVLGAVTGPVEAQRRDEIPDEAAVDVHVRPATGVGSIKERHLEAIVQSTLRHVILVHQFPRSLVQVSLQVLSVPDTSLMAVPLSSRLTTLALLPALLQTAMHALLSAALPLSTTFTSTLVCVTRGADGGGAIRASPDPECLADAASAHAVCYSAGGELLMDMSEGDFDVDEWDAAMGVGRRICCGEKGGRGGDAVMRDEESESLQDKLRKLVAER
ncbi:hypothetical protein BDY21DRAFT_47019 [Lineolata rhizophorae]|uniref:Exoribonuclease phosphorolytic domain-containing protein n=1 Tax=Lineolata rhizophorae TaxID=578093 RepID=A0A6A6NYY6_9PEZI|nr:hypothetical protein BDY21DRAFT_47019 [Lineolata rhizophorae]